MVTCLSTAGMCKQRCLSQQFSPASLLLCGLPGARMLAIGEIRLSGLCQERTKATLAGLYLSWTCAKHGPEKYLRGKVKGAGGVVGRLTHPRQKSTGIKSGLYPKRQSKTLRQAMKSSEHHSPQRHRLPTVINCTTLGKHTEANNVAAKSDWHR